uniref:Uncharacterized protein n=1 Tax=Schlesneria paludicola TaxID=360056 RepID=A0A7C2NY97_9PLAN
MSIAETLDTADFAKVAGPLLKEYVQKITRTRERFRELLHETEDYESKAFNNQGEIGAQVRRDLIVAEIKAARVFVRAVERLAQRVSQFLEHEAPTLPARMEIELRLADLEQASEALTREAEALETWVSSH